jgi:hypothetical protein
MICVKFGFKFREHDGQSSMWNLNLNFKYIIGCTLFEICVKFESKSRVIFGYDLCEFGLTFLANFT